MPPICFEGSPPIRTRLAKKRSAERSLFLPFPKPPRIPHFIRRSSCTERSRGEYRRSSCEMTYGNGQTAFGLHVGEINHIQPAYWSYGFSIVAAEVS